MPVADGTFTSACPRNCYSTCGLRVTVSGGRLRRLEAHAGNAATPQGICLKGLSYIERVYSPDRLLHPLARVPGTSEFRQVTWDEALDTIAGEVDRAAARVRAAVGPLLLVERHERAAQRGRRSLLAAVRRVHHHIRRSLLACRPRGHAPHARRQPAQRAVGSRERPPHRLVGQERRRDEHPPDGVRRAGTRTRRHARRHRSATHRDGRARGPARAAAARHRCRDRTRGRARALRARVDR